MCGCGGRVGGVPVRERSPVTQEGERDANWTAPDRRCPPGGAVSRYPDGPPTRVRACPLRVPRAVLRGTVPERTRDRDRHGGGTGRAGTIYHIPPGTEIAVRARSRIVESVAGRAADTAVTLGWYLRPS